MKHIRVLWFACLPSLAQNLAVLPPSVTLSTPESRQQLIAEASIDTHQADWTKEVILSTHNPEAASVHSAGLVRPVADANCVITVDNRTSFKDHVPHTK